MLSARRQSALPWHKSRAAGDPAVPRVGEDSCPKQLKREDAEPRVEVGCTFRVLTVRWLLSEGVISKMPPGFANRMVGVEFPTCSCTPHGAFCPVCLGPTSAEVCAFFSRN